MSEMYRKKIEARRRVAAVALGLDPDEFCRPITAEDMKPTPEALRAAERVRNDHRTPAERRAAWRRDVEELEAQGYTVNIVFDDDE